MFCGPLWPLDHVFRPRGKHRLKPSAVFHSLVDILSGVCGPVAALSAELTPLTQLLVAQAFVMVLVGFGGGRTAIWRLSAMVVVVEVWISGVKMARKER